MRKHFISYGSGPFLRSGRRLSRNAKSLGMFDRVKIYRRRDIPKYISDSPLGASKRGDGYWAWKPYVVLHELAQMQVGDILVYSDCGNQLLPGTTWQKYWAALDEKHGAFFRYREGSIYYWGDSCIRRWTKRSAIEHFSSGQDEMWTTGPQFWAGFFVLKKTTETCALMRSWHDTMIFRPDLAVDVFGGESMRQHDEFVEHRHDQALLTALLLTQFQGCFEFMPENSTRFSYDSETVVEKLRLQNQPLLKTMRYRLRKVKKRLVARV